MAPTARKKFDAVLKRCDGLCAAHSRWSTEHGVPDLDVDDLLRSDLAFGVSAMDAFFRDKFLDCLVPFVKKKATGVKVLAEMLGKADVKMEDVLKLLNNHRPHRTLRNKVADWLLARPMHDLDRVDELFLGFGLRNLTENAAKKSRMPTLRGKVAKVVMRRHEVVHYGDHFAGKAEKRPIEHRQVVKQLGYVRRLVDESENIIDKVMS